MQPVGECVRLAADCRIGERMAGRGEDERLFEHWQTSAVLGGTVHEARHGCHQTQESRDENRRRTAGCLLWHPLWAISGCLRMFKTSLQVKT